MDEARARADARHAMQTTLRYEQQDGRSEPAREGRFGRAPETTDQPVTDPTPAPDRDDHHKRIDAVHYEVDPDAVARRDPRAAGRRSGDPPAARRVGALVLEPVPVAGA